MSKSKLRGIVGYTCYTRPSLQCTYLSSLKPGKIANEEGSYLPVAFRGRYDRASTAPAGKTRTVAGMMTADIKEDSYLDIERPNPINDDIQLRLQKMQETNDVEEVRPLTQHWKSTNKETFRGLDGRPAVQCSRLRDDMPQCKSPEPPEGEAPEVNVLQLARNHALKSDTGARPGTREIRSRMRPKTNQGPRPDSREGQQLLRGRHRGGVMGTSQASQQIPGYSGFIAKSDHNDHALSHGFGKDTRASLKETLFDCYCKVLPGYTGFQPDSVHNVRTFDVQLVTTYGAGNHSMVESGRGLKRPEAGGESLILKEMFQAPLEGRPSDNGLTNAQTYYQCVRPFEGLPRIHYPSKTHMVGCKFATTSVANVADSGVNSPMKISKGGRSRGARAA